MAEEDSGKNLAGSRGDLDVTDAKPGSGLPEAEQESVPGKPYQRGIISLFRNTATECIQDKCPQLGAALSYFTVFSLAPLMLVLLAVFGMIFGSSEHAREKITQQLEYFLDPSGMEAIKDIAAKASKPTSGILATAIGNPSRSIRGERLRFLRARTHRPMRALFLPAKWHSD